MNSQKKEKEKIMESQSNETEENLEEENRK